MPKATLLAAWALRREGHEVEVLAEKSNSAARLARYFGPRARGVRIIRVGGGLPARTARYDLFINQLPGAYFPSFARRSWLWVHALPLNRPRHLRFYRLLANSEFTRRRLAASWGAESEVLHPPVGVEDFAPRRKGRIIAAIGTLGAAARLKNELALIRSFKELHVQGRLPGWSFHVAGELEGGRRWLERLREAAAGAPVRFHIGADLSRLRGLYGRAALLWHGCRREHFGMVLIEAMAAGCVPLAPDRGGPREIIAHGKTGWLYRSASGLRRLTLAAAEGRAPIEALAARGRRACRRYGLEAFRARLRELLSRGPGRGTLPRSAYGPGRGRGSR